MHDDRYTIHDTPERDLEASVVSRLPRMAGDEIDEERLIAQLHASIARETGRFGLPWWQAPWARGLMVTAGLMLATFAGLQVGQRLPQPLDRAIGGPDPEVATILADLDRAYAASPSDPRWLQALDRTADLMGQHARDVETTQLFTNDPAYRGALRTTADDYKL